MLATYVVDPPQCPVDLPGGSPALTPSSNHSLNQEHKPSFFSCLAPAAVTYGRSPVWWAVWHRFLYPSGVTPALGPWCQCACEATGSTIPVF